MQLVRDDHGAWGLLDGDREFITEGSAPRACPRCCLPLFLDPEVDLNFCAFCNAWTNGPPSARCAPSEHCRFCDVMRAGVRDPPLSRPLGDTDERVAEFVREVVPSRLMDTFPHGRH